MEVSETSILHRSVLTDTPNNKTPPAANKVYKPGRAGATRSASGSPSPRQSSRFSSRSVDSKPVVERRSIKTGTTPDRQLRTTKGLELPTQLSASQEDLKKVKEQLVSAQQEKAQALEELKDAKRLEEESNEKLKEALTAQRKAEERSDIAKFRADVLEQAGAEAAQKREEEWRKELESVKKRHASDVEALLSTTRELEKLRQELELNAEAKNSAVTQARDAMEKADTNAEKVEFLSAEICRLNSMLDSKLDNGNRETAEIIKKLDSEVDDLKQELETAKAVEDKLAVMEMLVERLSAEADDAKMAELDSCRLVDDWKTKAEGLEGQLAEAKRSEKSALDSLALSKNEISSLRGKVELLELKLGEADRSEKSSVETLALLMKQVEEASASSQDVESLEIEVAEVKRAELDAIEQAREWKNKAESIEAHLVESKQQEKSAMESLASVSKQLEESNTSLEDAESEAASLRVKVKSLEIEVAQYKHELMKVTAGNSESVSEEKDQLIKELEMARDDEEKAKQAMEGLASALHEVSAEAREAREGLFAKRVEFEDAHAQIEQLRSALRNTEENYEILLDEARYEIVCLKKSVERFETESNDSKAQLEVSTSEEEAAREGRVELRHAGSRVAIADEAAEAAKAEALLLKEKLSISQENVELRTLATAKISEENGELSNSEKEYDLLPNSEEIPVENGNGCNHYLGEEEPVEVEVRMLEGYRAPGKDRNLSADMGEEEEEALDGDLDLKTESGSFDQQPENIVDGSVSPTKQQQQQQLKKKKPLFQKFGSLLKKKNNHK